MLRKRIEKKRIVIYGTGRFAKDFLYIFNWIQPEYFVEDELCDKAKAYQCLQEESWETCMVIICKHDKRQAIYNLEALGMSYPENFILADDLFQELDFPLVEKIANRWVFIWGTGEIAHNFYHNFIENNGSVLINGCIDSDKLKQGKTFFGHKVYDFEEIKGDKRVYIIVATQYYMDIKEILERAGYEEEEDFIPYEWLQNPASEMLRKTIYDVPKMDEMCTRPFKKIWIDNNGEIKGCSSCRIQGNSVLFDSFENIWHSNRMKIIRLSLINRTATFCNKMRCGYFKNGRYSQFDVNELHYAFHNTKEKVEYMSTLLLKDKEEIVDENSYKLEEKEYPESIMISIDKTCNLQCPSCRSELFVPSLNQRYCLEKLTLKLQKEILPHINNIIMAGDGEVFVSPTYKKLLFHSSTLNRKSICILSNGSLFDEENWNRLEQKYSSIRVVISMDGATQRTAEVLRKGVKFKEWEQNMLFLGRMRKERRLDYLGFNFVVQRDNYCEMPLFAEKMIMLGADEVTFSRIQNYGRWTEKEFTDITMFNEKEEPKEELKQILKSPILKNEKVNLFGWHHGWESE